MGCKKRSWTWFLCQSVTLCIARRRQICPWSAQEWLQVTWSRVRRTREGPCRARPRESGPWRGYTVGVLGVTGLVNTACMQTSATTRPGLNKLFTVMRSEFFYRPAAFECPFGKANLCVSGLTYSIINQKPETVFSFWMIHTEKTKIFMYFLNVYQKLHQRVWNIKCYFVAEALAKTANVKVSLTTLIARKK